MASSFGGISENLRYYEFEMDSYKSLSSYTSQYTKENWPVFQIGGKKPLSVIAAIKILEVAIPFSYYVFTTLNNTFVLQETGHADVTVTIPAGNYTMTLFLPALVAAMNAVGTSTYTATFSTVSSKIAIYNNLGATSTFTLVFGTVLTDDGLTNPRRFLGFPGGATTSQTFVAAGPTNHGDVLLAPYTVNLSGPNYIFVNSQKIGNLADQYLPAGNNNFGNSGPQLAKVPVNTNAGGIIDWADPDPQKWFNMEGLNQLVDVDFFLTLGDSNAVLDLNGQNFIIKLGVLEEVLSYTQNSSGTVDNRAVKRIRNS